MSTTYIHPTQMGITLGELHIARAARMRFATKIEQKRGRHNGTIMDNTQVMLEHWASCICMCVCWCRASKASHIQNSHIHKHTYNLGDINRYLWLFVFVFPFSATRCSMVIECAIQWSNHTIIHTNQTYLVISFCRPILHLVPSVKDDTTGEIIENRISRL